MADPTDYSAYVDPSVDEGDDDGTMPASVASLVDAVVGHRIDLVDRNNDAYELHLDSGQIVRLVEEGDCCAYTEVSQIVQYLPSTDHVITAVTTTDGYTRWHILADAGEVLEMQVGWSCGNPFYYAYGLTIEVSDA